jgi:hypothetical protein
MSISSDSSTSRSISKSEFLSSLPPWRRFLAKLNWHPTVDAQISVLESERREKESARRENDFKKREQESARRTKLIENDIERLKKENKQLEIENKRLAEIESRLDALLLSADSSLPTPPATDSN